MHLRERGRSGIGGKRKHEVICQIMTDVPSYKVTDECGWSHILHQNQLLLSASEFGVPLCTGSVMHGTDVPAPSHMSPLPREVKV